MNTKNLLLLGLIATTLPIAIMRGSEAAPTNSDKAIHDFYKDRKITEIIQYDMNGFGHVYENVTALHQLLLWNTSIATETPATIAMYLVQHSCPLDVKAKWCRIGLPSKDQFRYPSFPTQVTCADLIEELLAIDSKEWKDALKKKYYRKAITDKATLVTLCKGALTTPEAVCELIEEQLSKDTGSIVMGYCGLQKRTYSPDELGELAKLKALVEKDQ